MTVVGYMRMMGIDEWQGIAELDLNNIYPLATIVYNGSEEIDIFPSRCNHN